MHPRRHLGGRGLGGRGIGQRSTSAGYSPTTALLAAAATPTLTWVTGPTDNTPQLLLNGALVEGATVREQHSTDNTFATYSESTNTVDAAEDAANELDFTGIGALADGTWYVRMRIESSGHFPSLWSNTETKTIDTTAPTLSSVVGTKTGQTTANLDFSTNEGNGTAYVVVTTSATDPTKTQVKTGKDHTGASATFAASQAVVATGAQSTIGATGLSAGTTYYEHVMHEDAVGNQSNVSASASFTTDAASSTPTTWDSAHKTNATLSAGNLTATAAASGSFNAFSVDTNTLNQKVYFEISVGDLTAGTGYIGVSSDNTSSSRFDGATGSPSTGAILQSFGTFTCVDSADNGAGVVAIWTTGAAIDVAFDAGTAKVWFRKDNGAWNALTGGTQNPATGQGGLAVTNTPSTGPWHAFVGADANAGNAFTATFASAGWSRTAPAGYTQLAS